MAKRHYDIRITPRRRAKPDTRKLARALMLLAQAEAERTAQVEHMRRQRKAKP